MTEKFKKFQKKYNLKITDSHDPEYFAFSNGETNIYMQFLLNMNEYVLVESENYKIFSTFEDLDKHLNKILYKYIRREKLKKIYEC